MAGSRYGTGRYGVGLYGSGSGTIQPSALRGSATNTGRAGVKTIRGVAGRTTAVTAGQATALKIIPGTLRPTEMTIVESRVASTVSWAASGFSETISGGRTNFAGTQAARSASVSGGNAAAVRTQPAAARGDTATSGGYASLEIVIPPVGSALRSHNLTTGRAAGTSSKQAGLPTSDAISGGDVMPLRVAKPRAVGELGQSGGRVGVKRVSFPTIRSMQVTAGYAPARALRTGHLATTELTSGGQAVMIDLWASVDLGETIWKQVGIN